MVAQVKGQPRVEQSDLNLSEENSKDVFAGGFHSTCCPMTSSSGTETHFILPMEAYFLTQKQGEKKKKKALLSAAFLSFSFLLFTFFFFFSSFLFFFLHQALFIEGEMRNLGILRQD